MNYYFVCMIFMGLINNAWGAEKHPPLAVQRFWASQTQPTNSAFNFDLLLKNPVREAIVFHHKQEKENLLKKTRKVGDLSLARKLTDLTLDDDEAVDITPSAPRNKDAHKEEKRPF